MGNKIIISHRVILQFTSGSPQFPSKCVTDEKKIVDKWLKLQEKCALLWNGFSSSRVYLCVIFKIWSILYMADFDVSASKSTKQASCVIFFRPLLNDLFYGR